jgi:hypothetical protein
MRMSDEERLEELRKKRIALDAEVNRLQARKRLADRKADTRRKILLGAVVMQEMQSKPDKIGVWAKQLLNERLKTPRDRALFELESPEAN